MIHTPEYSLSLSPSLILRHETIYRSIEYIQPLLEHLFLLLFRLLNINQIIPQIKVLKYLVLNSEINDEIQTVLCQLVRREIQRVQVLIVLHSLQNHLQPLICNIILHELYHSELPTRLHYVVEDLL